MLYQHSSLLSGLCEETGEREEERKHISDKKEKNEGKNRRINSENQ